MKAVADRLAEAFAEFLHEKVRKRVIERCNCAHLKSLSSIYLLFLSVLGNICQCVKYVALICLFCL